MQKESAKSGTRAIGDRCGRVNFFFSLVFFGVERVQFFFFFALPSLCLMQFFDTVRFRPVDSLPPNERTKLASVPGCYAGRERGWLELCELSMSAVEPVDALGRGGAGECFGPCYHVVVARDNCWRRGRVSGVALRREDTAAGECDSADVRFQVLQ